MLHVDSLEGFFDSMQNEDLECHFAWNFGNLLKLGKTTGMTIEWRQMPGVTTADECLSWTELTVGFVQAARGWKYIGKELKGLYARDVDGLKEFIKDRGGYPGRELSRTDGIFRGKSGRVRAVDYSQRIDMLEAIDQAANDQASAGLKYEDLRMKLAAQWSVTPP